jgi:hypothetical protein
MDRRRAGLCRLKLELRPCGHGEGFDVDAVCTCGLSWSWIGWSEDAVRAAEEGTLQWSGHRDAVSTLRRRGPATEPARVAVCPERWSWDGRPIRCERPGGHGGDHRALSASPSGPVTW